MNEENYDWERLEEVALALLSPTMFKDEPSTRAWGGLDRGPMDRLEDRGWIHNPKGKARSVVLTEEGEAKVLEFLRKHFQAAVEPGETDGPPQPPVSA